VRKIELTIPLPFRAPLELKLPFSAEFHHPRVLVAIADIKRAVSQHGDIGGQVEMRVIAPRRALFAQREQ
jgi:hypothetical protein